ncbi:MAG: hypothetical protein JWP74_1293 [Marmoricola sp.]|nr:hypothetical protein [Marmoricola sp.]
MTTPSLLAELTLPAAPPVVRASAAPVRRRRAPALVLLVIGSLLVVGPIAGGLFVKVASGQQMIDAFAPYITLDSLDQYDGDLRTLSSGVKSVDAVYADQKIPAAKYPGVTAYRTDGPAIDRRATTLLTRIRAAQPDYQRVSDIGGFDRIPFLLVLCGLALAHAGAVLLGGRRQRAGGAVVLALAAAVVLIAYPLVGSLPAGTRAGERLQHALAPVMTRATVRQEQDDFVVLVQAVGELDTAFRAEPRTPQAHAQLNTLVKAWPRISSDLASLVGTINDNLTDYQALSDLDATTSDVGVSGLKALPWFLVGVGAVSALAAGAALASQKRPRKALA